MPSLLFQQAVADVTPLAKSDRFEHQHAKPKPKPKKIELVSSTQHYGLSDSLDSVGDTHFLRSGVKRQVGRDLQRGRWKLEAELDLHGATREEARAWLVEFINDCQQANLRIVRIIHGQGLSSPNQLGVLKPLVRGWLVQHPEVLAYCPAKPRDGGEGALWVLLRNGIC